MVILSIWESTITLETNFACAYKRLSGLVNFSAKTHPECELKGNTMPQREVWTQPQRKDLKPGIHHSLLPNCGCDVTCCLQFQLPCFPRWDGLDASKHWATLSLPSLSCICKVVFSQQQHKQLTQSTENIQCWLNRKGMRTTQKVLQRTQVGNCHNKHNHPESSAGKF